MEIITELTKADYSTILIAVFTILIGFQAMVSICEWWIDKFGIETKWTKHKKEEHNLLIQTSQELSKLQKRHEEAVKQSIRHDEMIKNDISSLTDTVNGIADKINTMQTKIDHTEMAKLKNQILSYYKKYKDIGEWDEFESDVFWDLYDSYISHGGNSFVKQNIEPIMRELNVKEKSEKE